MRATVAICSYKRPDYLRDVLYDLAQQTASSSKFDVLVVGQDDDEATIEVVHTAREHFAVTFVGQPGTGLSDARNEAWRRADTPYITYVDDDCRLSEDYVDATLSAIQDYNEPHVLGGPARARYKTKKPDWFQDEFATFHLGNQPRELGPHEFVFGMNITIRRDLFKRIGGFDENLGMKGDELGYGEETELQMRARRHLKNYRSFYIPDLAVNHLVRPEKMTLRWNLRDCLIDGWYYNKVCKDDTSAVTSLIRGVGGLAVAILTAGYDLSLGLILRDRQEHPHLRGFLYKALGSDVRRLGRCSNRVWSALPFS